MPRLIAALIRHGDYRQLPDTPSAHQPFPLTDLGEHQAREAAAALELGQRLGRPPRQLAEELIELPTTQCMVVKL